MKFCHFWNDNIYETVTQEKLYTTLMIVPEYKGAQFWECQEQC